MRARSLRASRVDVAGRRQLVACAALLAAWPATARAGGFTISVIGGRRTGMTANVARPDDLTALFTNPAGLADQRGRRLHASGSVTFLSTEFRMQALDPLRFPAINPPGCGTGSEPPCPWPIGPDGYYVDEIKPDRTFGVLPYLGASSDLGPASPRLRDVVVSAAVYAPDFYGGFFSEQAPTAYHITEGLFLVLAASAGVGWRVNDHLAVGATLAYQYMRLGFAQKISIADVLTPAGQTPDVLAQLAQDALGDVRIEYDGVDHGLGWVLGLLVDPWPGVTLGLSYNGATAARFEGPLGLRALGLADGDEAALDRAFRALGFKVPRALTVEMIIPHALFFGVNLRPAWWLELGIDYRLWLYSLYKEQKLIPHYDADDPGQREPLTAEMLSRDKHYHVSYELSGGVLVRPWRAHRELELMAGLSFDRSPIPDETFSLDNPSLDQIVPAVGARLLLERWRVSATYMLFFHLQRDVRTSQTSPPTNAIASGVAHMPGVEAEYVF